MNFSNLLKIVCEITFEISKLETPRGIPSEILLKVSSGMSLAVFSEISRRHSWKNRILKRVIEGNPEETQGGISYNADGGVSK